MPQGRGRKLCAQMCTAVYTGINTVTDQDAWSRGAHCPAPWEPRRCWWKRGGKEPNWGTPSADNAASSPHCISSESHESRQNQCPKTREVIPASLARALFSQSKAHGLFHSAQKHKASFLSEQATRETFWRLRVYSMLLPLTLPEGRQQNQLCQSPLPLGSLHYRGSHRICTFPLVLPAKHSDTPLPNHLPI